MLGMQNLPLRFWFRDVEMKTGMSHENWKINSPELVLFTLLRMEHRDGSHLNPQPDCP